MSEPIMFKSREVVAVKTDEKFPSKCHACVGKVAFSAECKLLGKCGKNYGNVIFQYARPVKRKVALCRVWFSYTTEFSFSTEINGVSCRRSYYVSRKSAIRGARRFCASVGYECEIVKGDK